MLYSMTGFGEAAHEDPFIRVGFRIRTVNNKGLDLNIKLPFDFMYLEPMLRDILKQHLKRGRVDVFSEVDIRDINISPPMPLNRIKLAQIVSLSKALESHGVVGDLDINTMVRLPDLTTTERIGFRLPEAQEAAIRDTLTRAVEALRQSRGREGAQLQEDFLTRIRAIRDDVLELEKRAAERACELRGLIMKKVEVLLKDVEIDESRLSQEVVYQADRLDITEEITRLKAHINTTEAFLESDKEPKGKRMEFLLQEQLREVTTIGNKAKHKAIADMVVNLKTGYEKIREQALNVE